MQLGRGRTCCLLLQLWQEVVLLVTQVVLKVLKNKIGIIQGWESGIESCGLAEGHRRMAWLVRKLADHVGWVDVMHLGGWGMICTGPLGESQHMCTVQLPAGPE